MNGGLEKLQQAGEDVQMMEINPGQKEVKLVEAQKETDVLLVENTENADKVQQERAEVSAVRDVLLTGVAVVSRGKTEADADLAAAQPALEEAKASLDAVSPSDMKTLEAPAKPPELIKRIFDGVVIPFQLPPDPAPVYYELVKGSKMLLSSWETSGKPLLWRLDLRLMLLEFNGPKKDEINGETCALLLP